MKEIDLSKAHLKSAEQFIEIAQGKGAIPSVGGEIITLPFTDLVQLVAGYGALRMAFFKATGVSDPPVIEEGR